MRPGPTFASSEQNMKQSLLWRGLLVWACALAATGCSLLKVSVSSGEPLPDETLRLRTMTRGFYYDLSSGIAAAADSVVAASPRAATQLAAIRWKIRATRAAVEAAMQSDPEVALADTWILCRRMNEAFAQLPDSLLFGAESSIAREAAARFERRVARLSEQLLPADRQRLMERFVGEYVAAHPRSDDDGAAAPNTLLAWFEFLRANGREPSYATGSISEVMADVSDRVGSQTRQLANSVGWSRQMLEIRMQQDSLRSRVEGQLDSLECNFGRLVAVAEHLPGLSEQLLEELNLQAGQLIGAIDSSMASAFDDLDRQRVEIQHYVSTEREALVGQVQQAADEAVQHALERIPAVIGRLLFYVVAALVVLLGLPFLVGFWLGGLRARRQSGRQKAPSGDDSAPEQGGGSPDEGRSGPGESR